MIPQPPFKAAIVLFVSVLLCPLIAFSQDAIRINAGGGEYTDTRGNLYQADKYHRGGNQYVVKQAIADTRNDPLYQSERWGKELQYAIPVKRGKYKVRLHFAEIYFDQNGRRVFDVDLEGKQVLDDIDIRHWARGKFNAFVETRVVEVKDDQLNIDMRASRNNAKIAAIEVIPYSTQGGKNGGHTASATKIKGKEFTITSHTDYYVGDSVHLKSNGYVHTNVRIDETATYYVLINAKAELYGDEPPKISLRIGNTIVADELEVKTTGYKSYILKAKLEEGTHKAVIAFLNDLYDGPGKDRNVMVNYVRLLKKSRSGSGSGSDSNSGSAPDDSSSDGNNSDGGDVDTGAGGTGDNDASAGGDQDSGSGDQSSDDSGSDGGNDSGSNDSDQNDNGNDSTGNTDGGNNDNDTGKSSKGSTWKAPTGCPQPDMHFLADWSSMLESGKYSPNNGKGEYEFRPDESVWLTYDSPLDKHGSIKAGFYIHGPKGVMALTERGMRIRVNDGKTDLSDVPDWMKHRAEYRQHDRAPGSRYNGNLAGQTRVWRVRYEVDQTPDRFTNPVTVMQNFDSVVDGPKNCDLQWAGDSQFSGSLKAKSYISHCSNWTSSNHTAKGGMNELLMIVHFDSNGEALTAVNGNIIERVMKNTNTNAPAVTLQTGLYDQGSWQKQPGKAIQITHHSFEEWTFLNKPSFTNLVNCLGP